MKKTRFFLPLGFMLLISLIISFISCKRGNELSVKDVNSQYTIIGNFPPLAGQVVRLIGFNGIGIYTIDSTIVLQQGEFRLKYDDKSRGMGYLAAADNKAYFVILANEDISLKGEALNIPESVVTLSGNENELFVQYAIEHPKREQALSAWIYLQKIYQRDSLFSVQKNPKQVIENEIQRIKKRR